MSDASDFLVTSIRRRLAGYMLIGLGLLSLTVSTEVDWGVGWMIWVPAAALVIAGIGMIQRVLLKRSGSTLIRQAGFPMPSRRELSVVGIELELVATSGLWAVIMHQDGVAYPAATWVSRQRAERLAAWLDEFSTTGPWPRREEALPQGDV